MRWKSPSLEMGLEAERRAGVEGKAEAEEKDIQTFGPGWRVEFRPLEIQLTDFENAAFSLLTVLATRSLLAMGYNFYLPVSLMEENMNRAQAENAVMTQKFWVRKESFSPSLTTVPLTPGNSRASKNTVEGVKQFGTIKRATSGGEGTESPACLVPRLDEITAIELSLNDFFNGRQGNHMHSITPPLQPSFYISFLSHRYFIAPSSPFCMTGLENRTRSYAITHSHSKLIYSSITHYDVQAQQ
jgi:Glutamate-cysteine ligase